MSSLKIGDLRAHRTNAPTVRYYEEIGLLRPAIASRRPARLRRRGCQAADVHPPLP